jgi:hypothetical protein
VRIFRHESFPLAPRSSGAYSDAFAERTIQLQKAWTGSRSFVKRKEA